MGSLFFGIAVRVLFSFDFLDYQGKNRGDIAAEVCKAALPEYTVRWSSEGY